MAAPKSRTFQHRCFEDTKQEHQCSHNDAYPTVSGKENETNRERDSDSRNKGFTKTVH